MLCPYLQDVYGDDHDAGAASTSASYGRIPTDALPSLSLNTRSKPPIEASWTIPSPSPISMSPIIGSDMSSDSFAAPKVTASSSAPRFGGFGIAGRSVNASGPTGTSLYSGTSFAAMGAVASLESTPTRPSRAASALASSPADEASPVPPSYARPHFRTQTVGVMQFSATRPLEAGTGEAQTESPNGRHRSLRYA